MPIKVLIVDDSALIREVLKQIFSGDRDFRVVGCAPDAYVARELIMAEAPDVITLDVEMPRMDGLTFLQKMMKARPTPTVMLSSLTNEGADATLRALELGAVDFMAKPALGIRDGLLAYAEELKAKVRAAAVASPRCTRAAALPTGRSYPFVGTEKLIALGASTGGTEAVKEVLLGLPANSPAVVITQHMPAGFTRSWAERMNRVSRLQVAEAVHGQRLLPGHAYIAPGDYHLEVARSGADYVACLHQQQPVNRHRPAVDLLFGSVAHHAGANAVAALLTGMGKDGAAGLCQIRDAGGFTIAQDEASCVVFGMPREAILLGAACEIMPLAEIAARLMQELTRLGAGNRV